MKLLYKIGITGLIIGLVVLFAGFIAAEFDISKLDRSGELIKKEYIKTKEYESIRIDADNMEISVEISKTEELTFTYYENEKETITINDDENSNELYIESTSDYKWLDLFNIFGRSKKATLLLPKSFSGDIEIELKNGEIDFSNLNVNTLRVETKNGELTFKNIKAVESLNAQSKNGEIKIDNVTSKDITLETKNGNIRASNSEFDTLLARTNNGNVIVNKIIATTSIELNTSNGNLTGTITGDYFDYSFNTKTGNGKNNLPEKQTGGTIKLTCRTSNGNINIEFVE